MTTIEESILRAYLGEIKHVRATGAGTGETSYYGALQGVLNSIGEVLRPRVYCLSQMSGSAGFPDFGLFSEPQFGPGGAPEKIEALRTAVFNSALPGAPNEDQQAIFFRLIDELTPTHVKALAAARVRRNERHDSYGRRIYRVMPGISEQFNMAIVRDLQSRGLLWMKDDYQYPENNKNSIGSAPNLADEFLSFIGIPPHDYAKSK